MQRLPSPRIQLFLVLSYDVTVLMSKRFQLICLPVLMLGWHWADLKPGEVCLVSILSLKLKLL